MGGFMAQGRHRFGGLVIGMAAAMALGGQGLAQDDADAVIFGDGDESAIFADEAPQQPQAPEAPTGPRTGFEGQLDEVKVTARKREENLHKTPVAGTVLSGEDVNALVVEEPADLFRFVPGATTPTVGPESFTDLVIRGQGGGRYETSETATGIYKNGVYSAGGARGGRFYNLIDLFDIDRFEVFRGPQGGSFGRNAVGGAVNITTKKPDGEFGGSVSGDFNSVERFIARGVINIPLDGERLGLRTGGFYLRQFGGHITNSDGKKADKIEALGARATLAFDNDASWRGWLMGEILDQTSPAIAAYAHVTVSDLGQFERDLNTPSKIERDEWSLTGQLEHDTSFATVTAVGSVRSRTIDMIDDFDAWNSVPLETLGGPSTVTTVVNTVEGLGIPISEGLEAQLKNLLESLTGPSPLGIVLSDQALSDVDNDIVETILYDFTSYSGELRLASIEGASAWTWVAGVEFLGSKEDIDFEISGSDIGQIALEVVPGSGIEVPVPFPIGEFFKNLDITATLDFYSIAGFGVVGYDFGERANITVEGRYTVDHKSVDAITIEQGVVTPADTRTADESTTFKNFSPVASANLFFGDWLTVYGRFATAYRAGGFNFFTVPDLPESIRFSEEKSKSVEAGLKFRLINRTLQIDIAAFYMETEDIQVIDRTPQQEIFIFNAGDAFVEGIEFDIKYYKPLPAINSVFFGFAGGVIGRSEFLKGQIENGGNTLNLSGLTVPRARSFSASLVGVLSTRVWDDVDLRTVVTYAGQWGGYENPQNTQVLDDFQTVDMRMALAGEGWRAGVYVQNIFDEIYAVERISNTDFYNRPRTYGVEAKMEF